MTERVLSNRVQPNVFFTSVLEQPLPFKIAVVSHDYVKQFPDVFELGDSAYSSVVDTWLLYPVVSSTSETSVAILDGMWQKALAVISNLRVLLNEKDPSSQVRLRPDFTGLKGNIVVIKGEAKVDPRDLNNAVNELIDKFHDTAYLMFPKYCPMIPGVASAIGTISLHCIYYSERDGQFCQKQVKSYGTDELEGRVRFIVDIFKIAIWIVSQNEPIESFHLPSDVRFQTRNGHHVTLQKNGILKEFNHRNEHAISMDIIRQVYTARLPNVEQGIIKSDMSVLITTIGRKLNDAVHLYGVSKSDVLRSVQNAVRQLHSIGVAHCDICTDNIFVTISDNVVFLGDLEYCRPKDDTPPVGIRRAEPRAKTAEELDEIQLKNFETELERL
jgi:hypothetical protein